MAVTSKAVLESAQAYASEPSATNLLRLTRLADGSYTGQADDVAPGLARHGHRRFAPRGL